MLRKCRKMVEIDCACEVGSPDTGMDSKRRRYNAVNGLLVCTVLLVQLVETGLRLNQFNDFPKQ